MAAGFYVASLDGDFLGFVERGDDGIFFAHDHRGALLGGAPALVGAMSLVRAQLTTPPRTTVTSELVSVVYTSLATTRFDADSLGELLAQSREANARRDITGVLLYRGGRFLQVLEGHRRVVDALLEILDEDPRHHAIRILIEEEITVRTFGEWSMAYRRWHSSADGLPDGFRDTFADLEDLAAGWHSERAARELLAWFHHRPPAKDEHRATG